MRMVIALVDISSRTRSDGYHVVEKPYQSKGYGYLHKYAGSDPLYTNVSKFSHFAKSNLLNISLWKCIFIYILVKIIYMNMKIYTIQLPVVTPTNVVNNCISC